MTALMLFSKQIHIHVRLMSRIYFTSVYNYSKCMSPLVRFNFVSFHRSENQWNSHHSRRHLLYAGLLGWLGFKRKEKEEEEEDPLITTIKRGIISMHREDYNTAEQIFHLALKIAQERADQQAQTYIYDMMANNAFHKGDLPNAEKLFIEVMKRYISSGKPRNDNGVVEISLKLASIYSQQKQNEKAVEGFKFCISTQEEKINSINIDDIESLSENDKDTMLLWAMAVDWYGRHLMARGNFEAAQNYFQKALSTSEKINGPFHPQTLILMNDIGSIASLRKDFETALHYFEIAIEKGTLSGTPDLPSFYCNLGVTYMRTGDLSRASDACIKALKLAKSLKNIPAEKDARGCLDEVKKLKAVAMQ